MTTRTIPESAYTAIQNLIHFSESDFEKFLEALSKAEPSLDQDIFWSHVAKHVTGIDPNVIESILHEIFQMDDARNGDETIEEFTESIVEAAVEARSEKFTFTKDDEKIFKDRLVRIFGGRKGLDVTMKATGVLVDQDRVYLYSKILTDIRPIFNKKADSVDAAVIVHNLRIHYAENSDHKDFYVSLDTSDIRSLREALDRAEAKAKCLEGLVKKSGVSYLDAEE